MAAANDQNKFYELYRNSSVGLALTDTLDNLISDQRIDPQLAMRVIQNFDRAVAEVLASNVKSRMSFKANLDTYRFCDDVWTFIIKDITFKLENSQSLHSDKVKIVSCSSPMLLALNRRHDPSFELGNESPLNTQSGSPFKVKTESPSKVQTEIKAEPLYGVENESEFQSFFDDYNKSEHT